MYSTQNNCKTDQNNNSCTNNCHNCDCKNATRSTKSFHSNGNISISSNSKSNNKSNNSNSKSNTTNKCNNSGWNRLRLRENFLRRQKHGNNNGDSDKQSKTMKTTMTTHPTEELTKVTETTTKAETLITTATSSSSSSPSSTETPTTTTKTESKKSYKINIGSSVCGTLFNKICGRKNSNNHNSNNKMRKKPDSKNSSSGISNKNNNNNNNMNTCSNNNNESIKDSNNRNNCNNNNSMKYDGDDQQQPQEPKTEQNYQQQNYQQQQQQQQQRKSEELNHHNKNKSGSNTSNSNKNNNDRDRVPYRQSKWGGVINRGGSFLIALMVTSTLSFTVVSVNCQVCSQPPIPPNAKVKLATDTRQARYECDAGYELFGSPTLNCDPVKGWDKDLPFCGINIAFRRPVNQSSYTRQGPAVYANDGKPGNDNPDGQQCSETQKEPSPWWRVDLLRPQAVRVVRITTRGCCGHQPLQDLEIRVGNSSTDLQRNPLCAWYPGTMDEGITKSFFCARPLVGQYVAIQLVGVEGSLSLCEVEVFSNDGISTERCLRPNHNADAVVMAFGPTCYEFYFTRGESFAKAQEICESTGGGLIHDFRGVTKDFIVTELERRKSELKTQLVWIGAQKEPGLTSRTWKWINGEVIVKPTWGKDQPNNYNGEQNCVVLDGGRNWLWNDVGCNLDYLHFICQHAPLSCGSPDSLQNTTIIGQNYTVGNEIIYACPEGHALVGNNKRVCSDSGQWSGKPPTCKFVDCGALPPINHGAVIMKDGRTTFGARANYACNANYTLVGNDSRTCDVGGWIGSQPECLVDWCPDPPRIEGGRVKVTNMRAGSTAQYECEGGYVMIGESIISCGLGGEWGGKPPVCRFVDCGAPARPDRGIAILINNSTTVGSIVKYQCNEDHWLVGPAELSCTKEGRWSGDAPVCELITCDTPHVPPGSYVVGYDYNVHSSIEYHCDPGHILRGNPVLQCLESGEWSGDAPLCEYVDCGMLPPIPYGSVKYLQNTTYLDSEVSYSCVNSHRLSGVSKRTCLETGLWSDSLPKCEEIRCPEPVLAPHSILSVTGNDRMYGRTSIRTAESTSNSVQTYKIGSLAKYRCERGYKISGDPLVTCEEDGKWSGHVPECIYVDCGPPSPMTNGTVTLVTNATYYGAAASYECHKNFKLDGVSRRLCLENATWSHETPICREITCDDPEMSENLISSSEDRSVGSILLFSCQKGRYLVGNETRKCLKNGQWSGKTPICKPVDCGRPQPIENGRVIVINESTIYGASAEYHCVPNYNRIGPYLRKCLEDGKWSGVEPRCELISNEAQNDTGLGMGIGIGASIIILLLIIIGFIFLYRNKARPVKNTENVQAAESKEDRNAAVMSYSTLDASNRHNGHDLLSPATFNTFHQPNRNLNNNKSSNTENIYDQIPNEQFYDAPYEMRSNEEVYEPEPTTGNVITINGISVR